DGRRDRRAPPRPRAGRGLHPRAAGQPGFRPGGGVYGGQHRRAGHGHHAAAAKGRAADPGAGGRCGG
ncbi:MAG: hypothetical protein AVDCRST_MAG89-2287, partial [uncultured Gemmatimonadetes bacterium]